MREIRFRAWDGQRMLIHGDDPEDNEDEICAHGWTRFWCEMDSVQKEYDLMQFTGLKDKNGVCVYEGDIYNTGSKWNYQIKFVDGAWCGGRDDRGYEPLSWAIDCDTDELNADASWIERSLEVVGNIYQNGDLL